MYQKLLSHLLLLHAHSMLDLNTSIQLLIAISDELLKKDCVYLCGNSLGLQPRHTRQLLLEELDVWAERYSLYLP